MIDFSLYVDEEISTVQLPIPYCPLHAHSGYSLFDGFGTPEQRAVHAAMNGISALAVTDHGSMAACQEHYEACKKHKVKSIQGVEIYFMMKFMEGSDYTHLRRHMTLLAKNQKGYSTLCKLQTLSNLTQFYFKPIVDLQMLEKYHEGVICLSGCVLGEIPQMIINGDWDAACRVSEQLINVFGENFYYEVQPQNFDHQKIANDGLIKLSDKFGRPLVMTNDSHFVAKEDIETYMLVRRMGKQEIDEVKLGEIKEQYKELYISDGREMKRRWFNMMGTDGEAYIRQSQTIADSCEQVELVYEEKVPDYIQYDKNGNIMPVDRLLAQRTKKGLMAKGLWKEPYISRAKEELSVILAKQGKADYYLHVGDMVSFAKDNGVAVGPGRGSGSASLVAFALRIIDIDPVFFDLLFARFMTVERETIPDFDVDFGPNGYQKVLAFLEQRLSGRVAQIANIIRYKADNLINDLAKALNVEPDEVKQMKATIAALGYNKKEPEKSRLLFDKKMLALEQKYGIITHYCKIYGNPRAFGQHASGLAVTPGPIDESIPLFVRGKIGEKRINTSYDMNALTHMNIVKIDVLKLDAADMLLQCCNSLMIHQQTHETVLKRKIKKEYRDQYRPFTQFDIPLDDALVFDAYCNLNTKGAFQYDSHGATAIMQKVQPRTIFELADVTALDRPGSLNLGQVDVYVKGKNEGIDYTPFHAKFCQGTNGALIYQEQIMEACVKGAGMTYGEASKVMKNLKGMADDHPLVLRFVKGVRDSGLSEAQVREAFTFFKASTEYTFNKGHACAYAVLSYWLMWFKVHYPLIFFLASLKAGAQKENRKEIEADAVANGIVIFLPHVNGRSNYSSYSPSKGVNAIRAGLSILPGVGPTAANAIEVERIENGPFTSVEEFLKRVNGRAGRKIINKTVFSALDNLGALEFNHEEYRRRTIEYCSRLLSTADYKKKNGNGYKKHV